MITFATLFLGLLLGERPVEVLVGPEAAAVEFRLDTGEGEETVLGRLESPPWSTTLDFGPRVVPARFRAVALDAAGAPLGEAVQWLNLPHPRASLSGTVEPGPPPVLLLRWESSAGAEPESVHVEVDGAPVSVGDPRRVVLPTVDPDQLHVVHVEMEFEDGVDSRLDLTFGGRWVDEASAEMTAVPIRATGRRASPPSLPDAASWFRERTEEVAALSVEKGPAEITVVMARPFPHLLDPTKRTKIPKTLRLPDDVRVRFVSPAPEFTKGVVTDFRLFPLSPAYDGEMGDLYGLLTRIRATEQDRERDVTAAVAVAGSSAYRSRARRAVIVLLPSAEPATDELAPGVVLDYLADLRVPVRVWDPEPKGSPGAEAWGDSVRVGTLKDLAAAFEELLEDLDRQSVVWLEGRRLPQAVELAPDVEGWEMATVVD